MEPDPFSELEKYRAHPRLRPIMRQSWHHLTFFHRKFPTELIQSLLPNQLTVQTYKGDAYIGFVPFLMRQVRINGLPPLPNHRNVLETNVRTYVTDPDGRPGVWFFSLDCPDPLAVKTARTMFGLNYLPAKLRLSHTPEKTFYSGHRLSDPRASYRAEVDHKNAPKPASPGTLEFWLAERYLLFAQRGNRIIAGQVHHSPYSLLTPTHASCHESVITTTTGLPHATNWDSILYSPGVDVEIFAPQLVKQNVTLATL